MEFKSYNEIDAIHISSLIESIRRHHLDDTNIVYGCYRKIDGSNLQLTLDENDKFLVGSRNMFVKREDNFQNSTSVIDRLNLEEKLRQIKNEIINIDTNAELLEFMKNNDSFSISLFGEICGGLYRHKDVEKDITATRIQGRIDYSPRNEFIAFDIRLSGNNSTIFINLDLLKYLCDKFKIDCQIEEFRGTFDECLNFNVIFNDDTGNRLWGYPVIENNVVEGVVIKPINYLVLGEHRVILKHKNVSFKERIRKTKAEHNPIELNEIENKWYSIIIEYINENRVFSAGSKIGFANFTKLLDETINDAFKDFKKENEEMFLADERSFDPKDFDMKKIMKEVKKYAISITRSEFLKHL